MLLEVGLTDGELLGLEAVISHLSVEVCSSFLQVVDLLTSQESAGTSYSNKLDNEFLTLYQE